MFDVIIEHLRSALSVSHLRYDQNANFIPLWNCTHEISWTLNMFC